MAGAPASPTDRPTLWLIGMMGSGKSEVGRIVARRLAFEFLDTDVEVEASAGCSVTEIFRERGEAGFRAAESDALRRVAGRRAVIATGGGVVLSDANVTLMHSTGRVAWLAAEPGELAARIGPDPARPLLAGGSPEARLDSILAERRERYEHASQARFETANLDPDDVADQVVAWWTGS
ncbi:MAG: shikimate kinase [Acidimicrobiia bacterium]|jgi:shikimate kinase